MNSTIENNFGEQVYLTAAYPNGLTLREYHALTERQRRQHNWRPAVRGWFEKVPIDPMSERATESSSKGRTRDFDSRHRGSNPCDSALRLAGN